MKKCINYLLFFGVLLFVSCYKVEAATEMVCKYEYKKSYIYLAQDSEGNHYVSRMKIDGNNLHVWSGTGLYNDLSTFSKCPNYARYYNGNFGFYNDKYWRKTDYKLSSDSPTYTSNYSVWESSFNFSSVSKSYSVNLNQNKFGLINATIKKNDENVIGKKMIFYGYSFGGKNSPEYVASNAYLTDSSKMVFYNGADLQSKKGYTECSGSGCSLDVVNGGESICLEDGTNCKFYEDLKSSNYCIMQNAGYCASNCLGNYCDTSNDQCILSFGSEIDLKYKKSSYMLMVYSSITGLINGVYLPKDNVKTSDINARINSYNNSGADISYVAELFDYYNAEDISSLQSWNSGKEEKIGDECPKWLDDIPDAYAEKDYFEIPYYWKRFDVSIDDLTGNNEVPEGIVSDDDFDFKAGGPYYCEYNNGDIVMKVSYSIKLSKISLFFPNNENIGSAFYSYDFGKGTAESIRWISKDEKYGKVESGNNGQFEEELSKKNCPSQIAYDIEKGSLTICYEESDCDGVAGYQGKNPKWSLNDDDAEYGSVTIESCEALIGDELRDSLNQYFNIFRILVPIIVIVLGIVDFAKATFASKEDEMKKAQSVFIKRLIVCVIIFLLPTFINILMDIANTVWGWNADNCGIKY